MRIRTYTRPCGATGCPERSRIEYRARHELNGISPVWLCADHARPEEVLGAANTSTSMVLVTAPHYSGTPETLTGQYWFREGAQTPSRAVLAGPGFRAVAAKLPEGTRLTVTARVDIPGAEPTPDVAPTDPLAAFLADLAELTARHQLVIAGCGCEGSPWLENLDGPTDFRNIPERLTYDRATGRYTTE
ncbi:hypothetical protein ACFWVB_02625 [Streptomyces microflavus]|uniref:hypothetical protein n=1 Tax=Streptomyces microflavus TaxID=1919 RepID=UPI0036679D5D